MTTGSTMVCTLMYYLLRNVSQAQIEKQLPAFVEKYMGSDMQKYGFNWTLIINAIKRCLF